MCVACLLLFIVSSGFCQTNSAEKRQSLMSRLNHFRDLPDEVVIHTLDSAGQRAQEGDTVVLSVLFDLTFKSDGYVSELLGTILGDLFLKNSDLFLNSLSMRTSEQQRHIASMAFYMDGSGMAMLDFRTAEARLKSYRSSKNLKLSATAKECLVALRRVQRELKE